MFAVETSDGMLLMRTQGVKTELVGVLMGRGGQAGKRRIEKESKV